MFHAYPLRGQRAALILLLLSTPSRLRQARTSGGISTSLPTPVCRSGTDMRVDPKTYSNRWYHSYGAWRTDRSVDAIDQVNVLNGQNSGYYFRYDVDTRFV
jgi:hypothetical protein